MHDNVFDIEQRTGEFAVTLSISMQQFLDLYLEPNPDDPDTFEDEERLYIMSAANLETLTDKARDKAAELLRDAADCLALERLGATFQEASNMFSRKNGHGDSFDRDTAYEDAPYEADEDCAFMLYFASALYSFIFEARSLLDPPLVKETHA
jgi:hypothetical protein